MEQDVEMMEQEEEEEEEEEEEWWEASLLPEVWEHVLSFLPPQDLGSVALVGRGLGGMASLPRMWSRAPLRKITFRTIPLQHFFGIKRYSKISSLDFSRIQLGEASLVQLLEWSLTSGLRDLDLTGLNLSTVDPDLVSPALHRLRKAQLGFTKLTAEQVTRLFTRCANNPKQRPEELCLKAVNLSSVPSQVLAPALAHLIAANLSFTELTVEQVTALLGRIAARCPGVRLASLDLFSVDLSGLCPILLARAVASLAVASLSNTELRLEQAHALCDHALHSTTLTDLNLDFAELFSVPPEVVGRAMARLDRVSLACTVMGEEQLTALTTAMALPTSRIQHLDLLDIQLTFLPTALLVPAFKRLTKVNLSGSKLSPDQVEGLLTGLELGIIRDLNLDYVLLAATSPELLSSVACSLHTLSLRKTGLMEHQVACLFHALATSTHSLSSLCLHGVSLTLTNPTVLAKAGATIVSLDLSHCLLPASSAASLLHSLASRPCSLRSLTLLGNRMAEVPASALEAAAARLERLDLSSTGLTAGQLEAVLVSAGPPLKELSLFSLDLGVVPVHVLQEAERRVFVSHRHAAITPDS